LDDLDPFRRFEIVYPELGAWLDQALALPVPEAAPEMLDIAINNLGDLFDELAPGVVEVVGQSITEL
jgi:hypothetical protein